MLSQPCRQSPFQTSSIQGCVLPWCHCRSKLLGQGTGDHISCSITTQGSLPSGLPGIGASSSHLSSLPPSQPETFSKPQLQTLPAPHTPDNSPRIDPRGSCSHTAPAAAAGPRIAADSLINLPTSQLGVDFTLGAERGPANKSHLPLPLWMCRSYKKVPAPGRAVAAL